MSLSHDERRVLGLTTLSATDARVFVGLWLRSPDVLDVLMHRPGLRSAVLRRQATTQTVLRSSRRPVPTLLHDRNAPPRRRWRCLPPTGPAHMEHTSAVDDDEVRRPMMMAGSRRAESPLIEGQERSCSHGLWVSRDMGSVRDVDDASRLHSSRSTCQQSTPLRSAAATPRRQRHLFGMSVLAGSGTIQPKTMKRLFHRVKKRWRFAEKR